MQRYYDEGHSYQECLTHFGFCSWSWSSAIRRGLLKANARRRPIAEFLRLSKNRWDIRRRLLDEGLLRYECYECGISHWFGEKLPLHLDHINGSARDNRIENLRMLCPNCHSQTATFGGRNVGKSGP